MGVGDIIAGYAAVVATVAVAWPIWQARQARRPQVEVELHNTLGWRGDQERRALFLEARNRGDHPVRVITAGISDEHLDYIFMPGRIEVLKSPAASPHAGLEIPDLHSLGAPVAPPLPGIILPRDAGSRMLPDDAIAALLACGVKLRDDGEAHFAGMSDEDLSRELVLNLDGKLRGWVRLSTGEEFSTEPDFRDWNLRHD